MGPQGSPVEPPARGRSAGTGASGPLEARTLLPGQVRANGEWTAGADDVDDGPGPGSLTRGRSVVAPLVVGPVGMSLVESRRRPFRPETLGVMAVRVVVLRRPKRSRPRRPGDDGLVAPVDVGVVAGLVREVGREEGVHPPSRVPPLSQERGWSETTWE